MGFRLPGAIKAKRALKRSFSSNSSQEGSSSSTVEDVRRGHLAVYVGVDNLSEEMMRRFVIPVSYLNRRLFQDLLSQLGEEFGFQHPMGGLTIPCSEQTFLDLLSSLES